MTPAGGPEATGAPAASTLVVIDMQHVFADRDSQWRAPRFGEVVGPVRDLAAAYAPRVVFTRFVAPAVPEGAWRRYYELWPFALQPPESAIWDLVPEFAEHQDAAVDATTFGKWGPDLAARLHGGAMVLAGVSTDCCVLSTALAAADAGVQVKVAGQACAGIDDDSHAKALDIMRLYAPLVEVISLDQALAEATEPAGA
ncbi:MAG TPA: cysteine hydrolase [Streptosporangiaceae bacterium]